MLEIAVTRDRGFSLIELMTVVTVASIVLALGVPGLGALVRTQRLNSAAAGLHAALMLARSEAIRRGARVEVAPADGKRWENGWIVYADENDNGSFDPDDILIQARPAMADGIKVSSTFSQPNIGYHGSGRTRSNGSAQAFLAGTIRLSSGREGRNIVVNALGRARLCRTSGADTNC